VSSETQSSSTAKLLVWQLYERVSYEASDYDHWMIDRVYLLVPAQTFVGHFPMTFKDFPPRQKAASFSLDQVMQKLQEGI
jgi:hypothetical protein